MVDEVQLCRKEKLCRINTPELLSRVRVGYGRGTRVISDKRTSLSVSSESGRSSSIPNPSGKEGRKANFHMPTYSLLSWRSSSDLAFLGRASKS